MASRLPMLCTFIGCGAINCAKHGRKAWQKSPDHPQPQRLRGTSNQIRRKRWFALHPFCVRCEAAGETRLATILDHITPLGEGGKDNDENLQGLCQTCHDAKTAEESARGRPY